GGGDLRSAGRNAHARGGSPGPEAVAAPLLPIGSARLARYAGGVRAATAGARQDFGQRFGCLATRVRAVAAGGRPAASGGGGPRRGPWAGRHRRRRPTGRNGGSTDPWCER